MRQHGGYLMVDHRASPGLPEDVARWAGYDPALCREGKLFEADTLRCAHCGSVVIKNPARTRERHNCQKCSGRFICDGCAFLASQPDYVHAPIEKKIDQAVMGSPLSLLIPPSN
jgi:hypothetical protein